MGVNSLIQSVRNALIWAVLLVAVSHPGHAQTGPWSNASFDSAQPAQLRSMTVHHDDGMATPLVWGWITAEDGGWFVLDSGSPFVAVHERWGDALSPEVVTEIMVNGAIPAKVRRGSAFRMGRLTVEDPFYVVYDMGEVMSARGFDGGMVQGAPVFGVIGYAILKNAVVRIEYGDEQDDVFLFDPASYTAPPAENWLESSLIDRVATVEATPSGASSGLFKLETGKSHEVSLSSHFVDSEALNLSRDLDSVDSNPSEDALWRRQATLEWFDMAGQRVLCSDVDFSITETPGAAPESGAAGSIGRGLLKEFNLTFDYVNTRLALSPRDGARLDHCG